MSQVALVTGAAGQDGAYLCRDLLAAGWQVQAGVRPGAEEPALWRLRELGLLGRPALQLLALDVRDAAACNDAVLQLKPQQVFHLAAISSVARAAQEPLAAVDSNGLGALNLLEAVRCHAPQARFVLASSGEIFVPRDGVIDEDCALQARHPYALSKLLAHAAVRTYRESYGLAASAAILFNHESPLRGSAFVTRKIAAAAARRGAGGGEVLLLGDLSAQRDFGYAPDYVAGLRALAACAVPDDYVFASGECASIREFASLAYAAAGIEVRWQGSGPDEHALDAAGRRCIGVDPALLRRADAPLLRGDAARARRELGFANTVPLLRLVRLLVEAEQRRLGQERAP
ncbi:GDP-mannose 4,6-dehydratase [Tahibacter harae]|uniref:GDP-mannose 4,6-dehydratase n=1 Tax=Tahibacter harae TaxID=2963937 RepID=A0ABT1QTS2_9GAMM|nr:GDP-mannose 4,6-dehydratase [Tahibacter harae]MCQ4165684.1 GDP-mannose 4,6-dehydratase [Tahibacter harae]